jgi:glycosyltransferase involved in cell wall biosynthesis
MILKNEAPFVARTLASVKPYIERWCILDTGSTDGTQDVVVDVMKGVAGNLYEEPFVDFATTRNRGLSLCGEQTDFILWLDADDVLDGGDALRARLARDRDLPSPEREAYYVRVEVPGARFESARVLHARAGWRFHGVVHEVLMHPDRSRPAHRIADVTIRHLAGDRATERTKLRWERDVVLLERELEKNPRETRTSFYLGMTLLWLDRNEEAIAALERRIALGGWQEEVFYAKLSKARAAQRAGRQWHEVLGLYLDAHAAAPHRAEPLYAIAMHYDAEGDHALALLFARRAYELPLPAADTLFVEEDVYAWRAADLVGAHAYWLGELALGEEAARRAACARPDDARLAQNLGFYQAKR